MFYTFIGYVVYDNVLWQSYKFISNAELVIDNDSGYELKLNVKMKLLYYTEFLWIIIFNFELIIDADTKEIGDTKTDGLFIKFGQFVASDDVKIL